MRLARPVVVRRRHQQQISSAPLVADPTDAQQMAVIADMTVKVLNYDDSGSGWTLVQSTKDLSLKGYVPTNYIKMV